MSLFQFQGTSQNPAIYPSARPPALCLCLLRRTHLATRDRLDTANIPSPPFADLRGRPYVDLDSSSNAHRSLPDETDPNTSSTNSSQRSGTSGRTATGPNTPVPPPGQANARVPAAPRPEVPAPRTVPSSRRRPRSALEEDDSESSRPNLPGRAIAGGAQGLEPRPKRRRNNRNTRMSDEDLHLSRDLGGPSAASGDSYSGTNVSNGTLKVVDRNGTNGVAASAPADATYMGHDREEVTRLLIQTLQGLGYKTVAESLCEASGYTLENPTVAAFRVSILSGSWAEAERILDSAVEGGDSGVAPSSRNNNNDGLYLTPEARKDAMRFQIRQQKYLELLERQETTAALAVLRTELTPLQSNSQKLGLLSALLMCQSKEDLQLKAAWDGTAGLSRHVLLSELSKCISPSVMLPENRLATLLQQIKRAQIDSCIYHTNPASPSLYSDHHCSGDLFPREVAITLVDIPSDVWQIRFSHDGQRLAGAGSNGQIVVYDLPIFSVSLLLGPHSEGVGNVSWSPDDTILAACCREKVLRLFDAKTGSLLGKVEGFAEPVTACVWAADGRSFTLGTLDKSRSIETYALGSNGTCERVCNWNKKHRTQDLAGSPDGRWMVAADESAKIHVYNAFTRELEYELQMEQKACPTSLSISSDSRHLLVNRRDGEAQIIDLETRDVVQKLLGHTGGDFVIRSTFGGANENFVISGSEDGNILIWHKTSGAAIERLQAHEPRCNSVDWNPADSTMIASCGDDGKIKIWTHKARAAQLRQIRTLYLNRKPSMRPH